MVFTSSPNRCGRYFIDSDGVHGFAAAEDAHVVARRGPHPGIGRTKQQHAWRAHRGGQMTHAAVVTEKKTAARQRGGELGEGKVVGEVDVFRGRKVARDR